MQRSENTAAVQIQTHFLCFPHSGISDVGDGEVPGTVESGLL
jgi:hypothetical protein